MLQQLSTKKKKKNVNIKQDIFYDGILSPDEDSVSRLFELKLHHATPHLTLVTLIDCVDCKVR